MLPRKLSTRSLCLQGNLLCAHQHAWERLQGCTAGSSDPGALALAWEHCRQLKPHRPCSCKNFCVSHGDVISLLIDYINFWSCFKCLRLQGQLL